MSRSRTKSGDAPHIYSHEYFQRLSGVAERHWWVLGMRAIAERLLDPHLRGRVGTRVLDAGSGTGGNLAWLQRYADPRHIVGIDYSSIALAFSETDARRRLAQASVMALPFADGRFDLVNCTDVIQHLPQDGADQRALQEFSRVLRPGGLLFLRTNVYTGARTGRARATPPASSDYRQYTLEELGALFAATGWVVEKLSYGNMLPALITTWIPRLGCTDCRPYTPGTDRGHRMNVPPGWLNRGLKLYMCGEAWYLAGRGRTLPYGHSLISLARKASPR